MFLLIDFREREKGKRERNTDLFWSWMCADLDEILSLGVSGCSSYLLNYPARTSSVVFTYFPPRLAL